jgi:hypothetical protein
MNDAELDRLVAATAPITEARVAALDLRDAEVELMEQVMATSASTRRSRPSPRLRRLDDGTGGAASRVPPWLRSPRRRSRW